MGIIGSISDGVTEFTSEAREGFQRGEAISGTATGLGKLAKHLGFGASSSVSKFASSAGQILASTVDDKNYLAAREAGLTLATAKQQSEDPEMNSETILGAGVNILANNISSGVRGVATGIDPFFEKESVFFETVAEAPRPAGISGAFKRRAKFCIENFGGFNGWHLFGFWRNGQQTRKRSREALANARQSHSTSENDVWNRFKYSRV